MKASPNPHLSPATSNIRCGLKGVLKDIETDGAFVKCNVDTDFLWKFPSDLEPEHYPRIVVEELDSPDQATEMNALRRLSVFAVKSGAALVMNEPYGAHSTYDMLKGLHFNFKLHGALLQLYTSPPGVPGERAADEVGAKLRFMTLQQNEATPAARQ